MSALVEKKTGLEGRHTLIQSGFLAWWRAGSILAQDIGGEDKAPGKSSKRFLLGGRAALRRGGGATPVGEATVGMVHEKHERHERKAGKTRDFLANELHELKRIQKTRLERTDGGEFCRRKTISFESCAFGRTRWRDCEEPYGIALQRGWRR
jgi:hypothetical protein